VSDNSDQQCSFCGLEGWTPPAPTAAELQQLLSAATLNTACFCPQLPPREPLPDEIAIPQYAAAPLFVAQRDIDSMRAVIRVIDTLADSDPWRARVLPQAPAIAQRDPGYPSVLFGFDFHLTEAGPQLIEINTNAGGALVATQLLSGQSGCCELDSVLPPAQRAARAEGDIIDSLFDSWRCARGDQPLQHIAIVDEQPASQYLYAEFRRFAALLSERGIVVTICDPRELTFDGSVLRRGDVAIDLLYNRLTDFYLEAEHLSALRDAYVADRVVLTPHPHAHALYADKRLLALLSDDAELRALGVDEADRSLLLRHVPLTRCVDPAHADMLWNMRRELFFKPAGAYGGRGAYQGAKLTRATFQQILAGDYVAQREVPPPTRRLRVDGERVSDLKSDLRCYVYRGEIQLLAARLWRGQTTNFRTPGGGFASVSPTAR
jgi:hypothetical protein